MPSRVAVLEQIARDTAAALGGIRDELRTMRGELRGEITALRNELRHDLGALRGEISALRAETHADLRDIRQTQRSDFRWLLGILLGGFIAMLGAMAHGFHWL